MRPETFNHLKWSPSMSDYALSCYYAAKKLRDNGAVLESLTTKEKFGDEKVWGNFVQAQDCWPAAQDSNNPERQVASWVRVHEFREVLISRGGDSWRLVVDKSQCYFFADDLKLDFEFGSIVELLELDPEVLA